MVDACVLSNKNVTAAIFLNNLTLKLYLIPSNKFIQNVGTVAVINLWSLVEIGNFL